MFIVNIFDFSFRFIDDKMLMQNYYNWILNFYFGEEYMVKHLLTQGNSLTFIPESLKKIL